MGSKNKIAEWVVSCLPPAEHFYDLFCGGCAVTHAAIAAHRYKSYHVNDITDMGLLFRDIVTGKRKVTWEWVSREDFYARKDTDPLVRTIWSFGNDNSTYLYGKEVEPVKKALHEAIVNRDYTHTDALGLDLRPLDSVDGVYSRYLAYRRLLANITPPKHLLTTPAERIQSTERTMRLASLSSTFQGRTGQWRRLPPPYWRQRKATTKRLRFSQTQQCSATFRISRRTSTPKVHLTMRGSTSGHRQGITRYSSRNTICQMVSPR